MYQSKKPITGRLWIAMRIREFQNKHGASPTTIYLGSDQYTALKKELACCRIEIDGDNELTFSGIKIVKVLEDNHFRLGFEQGE